ncbi:toll/interleukin-1 receptor domain-containing protein [Candidatus Viadribacter manganicus]|uniref:TIR domain-containing protein n=1 Tax=Candidatus Viadribacter manganicus TaxID=1759059 RepID=A0A1B1AGJ8_9PROT|nr:toll/interleukin-1 receptor domain-containing protein [Candidatus Viadribacter manganicus]ANP45692.1 hypothetical protein ATE48_07030 [Candidatus Viadribacter manganicus]
MKFVAFISYAHADQRFAKKLHTALEQYRIPAALRSGARCREDGGIGRLFRDDDELGAGDSLGAALEGAIDESANMIVIASPASATSKWVDKEVRRFKRRQDGSKVLAVIVAGSPGANTSEECFCPSLKVQIDGNGEPTTILDEPLAPNASKEPFRKLVVRLVAALSGLDFDVLWQRNARRQRGRMMALAGAIVGLTLVGAISVQLTVRSQLAGEVQRATSSLQNRRERDQAAQAAWALFDGAARYGADVTPLEAAATGTLMALNAAPSATDTDRYTPEQANTLLRASGLLIIPERIFILDADLDGNGSAQEMQGPIPILEFAQGQRCVRGGLSSDNSRLLMGCALPSTNEWGDPIDVYSVYSLAPGQTQTQREATIEYHDLPLSDDPSSTVGARYVFSQEYDQILIRPSSNRDEIVSRITIYAWGIAHRRFVFANSNGRWLVRVNPFTVWEVSEDSIQRAQQDEPVRLLCANIGILSRGAVQQMYPHAAFLRHADGEYVAIQAIEEKCRALGYNA